MKHTYTSLFMLCVYIPINYAFVSRQTTLAIKYFHTLGYVNLV